MKKDRKWFWVLIALAAVIVVWIFIKWFNSGVVPVKTAAVVRGPIQEIVSSDGIVNAPVYNLGTKMGGRIAVWHAKEGDMVKKGQLLCEFDSYEQARNDFERTRELFKEDAASQQQFDAAKTIFENSRIVSPNDGMVSRRYYEEGETVVPGSPAIQVVNYSNPWVEGQIDEVDISKVKIGDIASITSDDLPDRTFTGEVYWIAPVAELRKVGGRVKIDEESYVFPCKARFIGEHSEMKVNMSVNIDIATDSKPNAMLIPREALLSKDDTAYVFEIRKGHSYQTQVGIGIRSFTSVEAASGVNEGDTLAVSNLAKLQDKGRIKIER
ncbi:MAG TPA: efflux RND transporter periplasmic adaptor subunit [Candidatus Omnitrophota bacterium]|nr:efflux RND transporter periplasmic adaptor subunit [Candidatus Omnitrophota bacterium]